MSRILFFIFIVLLITNINSACSDRYKFQFERGSNFDRRLLAHTERIFPQQNGVVVWVSNPDDTQSNSLIETVKVLDRQHLKLHIWVCPTDLYANFKLGQKTISKIDFSLYSVKKILKVKISDCRFDQVANEIGISTISGQYCYTNLLRFTNSSQLKQLILQIIAYNSNP